MISIAMNVKIYLAEGGFYNQKPFNYHPDTWAHGGGDFIFITKKIINNEKIFNYL